ncbi:MAG TPA: methylmalonyl-CoA mutase family protein [Candidatus Baltobacteraceae bacterium]|nr:methylmalonyl-CoA mutase family protein [Candidatus Baltobacteraceae bacterium]
MSAQQTMHAPRWLRFQSEGRFVVKADDHSSEGEMRLPAAFDRQREDWEARRAAARLRSGAGSGATNRTISDLPLKPLYAPQDGAQRDLARDLAYPGEYPYTRGIHPNMYRERLWTMRQFAGFGNARQTNERYHYLLGQGQTGLSVAFDMPTLMGYDSDAPRALGEVGKCGVAVDSLADMEQLFAGIDMGIITTSMTINGPACIALAQYIAAAEKKGIPRASLGGTIQADILKEYIAQKEWIFPPRPHVRIIVDMMRFCRDEMPKWNTISISGYHIREAGSTAVQELAFTLADGFAYVEAGIAAGMDVDSFAPRLSFFFNSHIDFFEEICKFRAARRIWARHLREKFGAKDPRSWQLRFHTQTAGCSATAQQPINNVVRVAYEAMAAVLGGTQSLHTNSMDEVLALPSERSVEVALRTQQILAYETNVGNVADPLGGSYFIESLTDEIERQAEAYFAQIAQFGGVIEAIEAGFFQREIADASYRYQRSLESRERVIVGVNAFERANSEHDIELLKMDATVEHEQMRAVQAVRAHRNASRVEERLAALKSACADPSRNVMPPLIAAVEAFATEGEIVNAMVEVYGRYVEHPVF